MNGWIIQRDANETGFRSNQTWSGLFPTDGYVWTTEEDIMNVYVPFMGFVNLEIDRDTATKITGNQELLDKWKIKSNLVCDPVYSLEVENPERTPKIGVQLRKYDTLTDELFDNIIKQVRTRFYNREIELLCLQDEVDAGISQVFINKLRAVEPKAKVKLIKEWREK